MMTWNPPKSPYDLLQERFWPDEWKVLVVCLMLNQTSRKQVEPMISRFFTLFPNPESVIDGDEETLRSLLRPLGLVNRRTKIIKRFSEEFVTKKWVTAKDLYGCGKYADDAYRIFIKGEWEAVEPSDHALNDYHNFLVQSHHSQI